MSLNGMIELEEVNWKDKRPPKPGAAQILQGSLAHYDAVESEQEQMPGKLVHRRAVSKSINNSATAKI